MRIMSRAKSMHVEECQSPDGRSATVKFMDNGTIHLILPPGQSYSILTHYSGGSGTRLRLAPVGVAAADVQEDDE
jgi:hypothetical protein